MINFATRAVMVAAAAAAVFTVVDVYATSHDQPTPASIVATRFLVMADPSFDRHVTEADFEPLRRQAQSALQRLIQQQDAEQGKKDKLDIDARSACRDQTWPHVSPNCLRSGEGKPAKQTPTRPVIVDLRTDPGTA
jgi:hypothetical protein